MIFTPYFFDWVGATPGSFPKSPTNMQTGILTFYGNAAERIHRIQKTGVLHHHQRTVARREETAANRDPFVFLAYLDHFEVAVTHDGLEQDGGS